MLEQWIKQMFWWLPTKEEQYKHRKELKDSWIEEVPQITAQISEQQKIYDGLLNQLEDSLSRPQMELYLDCKISAQKLVFLNSRLNHHKEEIEKPIFTTP